MKTKLKYGVALLTFALLCIPLAKAAGTFFTKLGGINIRAVSADPASAVGGDMYFNPGSDVIRVYLGSAWSSISGSNPMTTGGDIIYGGAGGVETRLANGTSGKVLTSNGTTLAPSWQSAPAATALGIQVRLSVNVTPGANTIIKFDTIDEDTNSAYSAVTGLFTAPSAGRYLCIINVNTSGSSTIYIEKNGSAYPAAGVPIASYGAGGIGSGSLVVTVSASDTIGFYIDTAGIVIGTIGAAEIYKIGN